MFDCRFIPPRHIVRRDSSQRPIRAHPISHDLGAISARSWPHAFSPPPGPVPAEAVCLCHNDPRGSRIPPRARTVRARQLAAAAHPLTTSLHAAAARLAHPLPHHSTPLCSEDRMRLLMIFVITQARCAGDIPRDAREIDARPTRGARHVPTLPPTRGRTASSSRSGESSWSSRGFSQRTRRASCCCSVCVARHQSSVCLCPPRPPALRSGSAEPSTCHRSRSSTFSTWA